MSDVTLGLFGEDIVSRASAVFSELNFLDLPERVATINALRSALHELSPFKDEPVDCVIWVPSDVVTANDYNPNTVAPPEMRLLELSIAEDGYTQPVVAWRTDNGYEVVDGFHRTRVGKESPRVRERVMSHIPITVANMNRLDRSDRMAATIRHNRARGKHQVGAMSDIIVELKRRNWSNERIAEQLGMDQDEILRLCQITGLAELFSDQQFSQAWDVEGEVNISDFKELTDDVSTYGEEVSDIRTVNTSDPERVFHTYEKWECYRAGFYATTKDGMSKAECEAAYSDFLRDLNRFEAALVGVITEWKHSCEHYLTNNSMNRIAWLGQAAACYALGIPAVFRGGFHLLTADQQKAADEMALKYLNRWLEANGRQPVSLELAYTGRQSDVY